MENRFLLIPRELIPSPDSSLATGKPVHSIISRNTLELELDLNPEDNLLSLHYVNFRME
jgi:hypothetical protein